jgi:hypothetical protein
MGLKDTLASKPFRTVMTMLGIGVSIAIIIVAIFGLISSGVNIKSVIACVYQAIFGTMLLIAELRMALFFKWFRFMVPFVGLGAMYVFVAVFTIQQGKWWQILVAAVCGFLGAVNCLFFCFGVDRGIELNGQPSNTTSGGQPIPGASAAPVAAANKDAHVSAPSQPNPFENDNPFSSSAKAY